MRLFKSTVYAFGCVLFAVSSGCVSYKPPPNIIHADNYTAEAESEQRRLPSNNRVLTVEEAINIAVSNSPTYKIARLNMISYYAMYYQSLSVFSPTLGMNYGQKFILPIKRVNSSSNASGSFGLRYNAFNGMQDVFGTLSASANAKKQEYLYANVRRLLIQNTRLQYYQILLDKAQIQIDLGNQTFQEQMLNDEQLKYNAGASSLSGLLNFKIGKNAAQSALIKNKARHQVDRYKLAQIMGLTTSDIPSEVKFPPIEVIDNSEFSMGVEFYLDLAIKQRPELSAQKETLKAAKYALYKSWGAFAPTVAISMDYGFNRTNTPLHGAFSGGMSPDGNNTSSYGWNANWSLWKGGSRIFAVKSNTAQYDVQKEKLLQTWISVVEEVRKNYLNLNTSIAVRKIQAKTLQLARERRDLVREEYNAGSKNIATLNQAQNQLISTESSYIKAVITVAMNRAKLSAACGGIKDF